MKVIGLTGGIGSGKSTVAHFLAELGAVIIDADKVGHEAFKPGTELWQEVTAAFGEQILTTSGEIDRQKLGEMVFADPRRLSQLNEIMHPRMSEMVKAQLEDYRRQRVAVAVLEATLLIEAGGEWTKLVDEIWVTVASEATVLKRVMERSGLSEAESLARIRSQMPPTEKVRHADVVINTEYSLDEMKIKVKELWHVRQIDRGNG
ncbi:MAG TPA: dephospho-CoA kinase [Dehalococcoidia bacterium]|nr:dephospho-CoA kinase [Dehalococcoidia bacterium]